MKENIVLIDSNVANLELLEDIIYDISPEAQCISFIYADEAVEVVSHELKRLPQYIFIAASLQRLSGTECLRAFRENEACENCCISIFSTVMPETVSDTFRSMGANFAFQKPLTRMEGKEVIAKIFSANQRERTIKI